MKLPLLNLTRPIKFEPPINCEICGAQFNSKSWLNTHLYKFHKIEKINRREVSCEVCMKKCKNKAALQRHQYNKHLISQKKKKLVYSCDICGRTCR